MPSIRTISRDADVNTVAECLLEEGCVIIESLASEDTLRAVAADLDAELAETDTNNTEFAGRNTKRFNGLLTRLPATQQLALNPLVLGVVDELLSPYCVRHQLNYDGVMHLMPGESSQPIHRDGGFYPFRHPTPPFLIACMWAQSDFTEENGGTNLVPGSHLWDTGRTPETHEICSAVMPPGSVVIYTGGVFHGAGANRSNQPRTGISFQYSYAWLRQELNMFLTYPPEVAKHFPEALQALIGYQLGAPYLGFIDAGSPHLALDDNAHSAIRERSTPEMDAAKAALKLVSFDA